jgi:hypothetical protein
VRNASRLPPMIITAAPIWQKWYSHTARLRNTALNCGSSAASSNRSTVAG